LGLDIAEWTVEDTRRLSGSSLICASWSAIAKAVGASKDPGKNPSSFAGVASSSPSLESLSRPLAIWWALRIASSMHSWTKMVNSTRIRSAYSIILRWRMTASALALATLSVSAHSKARPCSCSRVFVPGVSHCKTWVMRPSDCGDCVLNSPGTCEDSLIAGGLISRAVSHKSRSSSTILT